MQSEGQPINILLVDDKPNNLLSLESILESPDRNMVRASSGDEALRYLLDSDVAVILLDVHMPGINGLETAALIRGRDRTRNTPIIFLTADNSGGELASMGYSLGAVDYIQKPLDAEILRSKVAVFVELFKKTEEVKRQAQLLHEKNIELENANLRRLSLLVDLGQQLAAQRNPDRLLDTFCAASRNITGARHAAVGIFDTRDGRLRQVFSSRAEGAARTRITVSSFQILIAELQPSREKPTRVDAASHKELSDDVFGRNSRIGSLLIAPLHASSRHYGWLCLADEKDDPDFTEADERLAVTLTSQVAVAYENAWLFEDAQRHAAELQQEVAERILAEQERARLLVREQQARAEAESANRTKDEFLATLSHELRTPLTAILGWSHLLRMGRLPADSIETALETIERNAKSQSQLIDDLLDVSRIVTGKLRLEVRPIDVAPVVEAALQSIQPLAESKGIQIEKVFDDAPLKISGDPTRLQQIVWNLLSNAIKFTPVGGRVAVRIRRQLGRLELEVRDTGQGITSEFLPHVFDRFRQADGTTTRAHGGLGLGLAIVRHLVELHGGAITVRSDGEGMGAVFVVDLPLLESEQDVEGYSDDPFTKTRTAVEGKRSNSLKGLEVLVIDDDEDTREMISTLLSGCGAVVRACGSTAEALEVLEQVNPAVIVSDIGMPDEDGYSFIRRLRKMFGENGCNSPAIALTAYASNEDRNRSLAAGFQVHISKPLEPDVLVAAVANLVGRGSQLVRRG
jgi:signal transduction histidine kinase/DNA-binding response OmpR family regulator